MPFDYTLDRDAHRVIYVWSPPASLAEVIAALEQQAADGAWRYGVLHDVRAVSFEQSRVQPGIDAIRRLSEVNGRRGPVALVANPADVGFAQRYAFLSDRMGQLTQVFWDREEAEHWLRQHTGDV